MGRKHKNGLDPLTIIEALERVECKHRIDGYKIVAKQLGCSFAKVEAIGLGAYKNYPRPVMPGVQSPRKTTKPKNPAKKKTAVNNVNNNGSTEMYVRECNHPGLFGGDPIRQMVSTKPWTKEGLNFEI